MSRTVLLASVVASLGVGAMLGYPLARGGSTEVAENDPRASNENLDSAPDHRGGGRGISDEPPKRRSVGPARSRFDEPNRRNDPPPDDTEDPSATATTSTPPGGLTTEERLEIERLHKEIEALRQDRLELMGKPIERPVEQPEKFEGTSMSSAVSASMQAERIGGAVEATDCSEHPCIIFGRLEGDEEDMEEIERSPALAHYRDDVITLLFWATSVEDEATSKMPETGLFALAFYAVEERAERGDELDRRSRARVMGFWNSERPG